MHSTRLVGLLVALSFALAGCAEGFALWKGVTREPTFWWETTPATVSYVDGPQSAIAGQPVVLSARVIVGSSSCARYKDLQARVDEASRSVLLSGIIETKRSDQPLACTSDLGGKLATVSVTLPSAGVYRVTAERFDRIQVALDETPRATIDIQVTGS